MVALLRSRRELHTALDLGKVFIPIWEPDRSKGGATLEELRQEALHFCAAGFQPVFQDAAQVVAVCIDAEGNYPIPWVRSPVPARRHAR